MRYRLIIVGMGMGCMLHAVRGLGQQGRQVSIMGKVTDADSHAPLAEVSVINSHSGTGTLTDSAGTYQLAAGDFDRIIFSFVGYLPDTVQVNALYIRQRIDVSLHKRKYNLEPVEIVGHKPDYRFDSLERRSWFSDALDQGKTRGLDAVNHPITALYDALSGRQKRLWRFQKDYQQYEEQQYVRSRVRPGQIEELFGLKGDSLEAFLLWYHPPYLYVRQLTDYDLLVEVKRAVALFRKTYRPGPPLAPAADAGP